MTATSDPALARRYLLGEASDEESTVLEQEYLAHDDAIDRIAAAEDDLIEDYLANQLTAAERDRFERSYLASPQHRVRVETIRRLMARGAEAPVQTPAPLPFPSAASKSKRVMRPAQTPWLALAASLLLAGAVAIALFTMSGRRQPQVAQNQPPQPSTPAPSTPNPPPASVRVFALTVSPVTVRSSGSETPPALVPAGTGMLIIRLERDASAGTLTPRRASIRTVAGVEVWQGPVTEDPQPMHGIAARLDVPAVPADDYLIALYGTDRTGAEREMAQYFLRLRAR
jgi:hypothetical protein